jgi:hypothetical protein
MLGARCLQLDPDSDRHGMPRVTKRRSSAASGSSRVRARSPPRSAGLLGRRRAPTGASLEHECLDEAEVAERTGAKAQRTDAAA